MTARKKGARRKNLEGHLTFFFIVVVTLKGLTFPFTIFSRLDEPTKGDIARKKVEKGGRRKRERERDSNVLDHYAM